MIYFALCGDYQLAIDSVYGGVYLQSPNNIMVASGFSPVYLNLVSQIHSVPFYKFLLILQSMFLLKVTTHSVLYMPFQHTYLDKFLS
jgi:hypothetical protein